MGKRPSYTWKSILAARKVVDKWSQWNVGNERDIHMWNDRWIPTLESFKVVSLRTQSLDSEMVSSFIDKERSVWDGAKIRSLFLPYEANVILDSKW